MNRSGIFIFSFERRSNTLTSNSDEKSSTSFVMSEECTGQKRRIRFFFMSQISRLKSYFVHLASTPLPP